MTNFFLGPKFFFSPTIILSKLNTFDLSLVSMFKMVNVGTVKNTDTVHSTLWPHSCLLYWARVRNWKCQRFSKLFLVSYIALYAKSCNIPPHTCCHWSQMPLILQIVSIVTTHNEEGGKQRHTCDCNMPTILLLSSLASQQLNSANNDQCFPSQILYKMSTQPHTREHSITKIGFSPN